MKMRAMNDQPNTSIMLIRVSFFKITFAPNKFFRVCFYNATKSSCFYLADKLTYTWNENFILNFDGILWQRRKQN